MIPFSVLICFCLLFVDHLSAVMNVDLQPSNFQDVYIEGAIIVDRHSKAERYFVRHNHVSTFVEEYKSRAKVLMNKSMLFGEWPPVFTNNCPQLPGHPHIVYRAEGPGRHPDGFERGLMIAHRAIWEDFIYRTSNQTLDEQKKSFLLVFEDDAFPRIKNHIDITLQEILNIKEHIKFLGWCMADPNSHAKPPYCTHAYAVSGWGARILHNNFIQCGPSIDVQFIDLAAKGVLQWEYASPESYAGSGNNNDVKAALAPLGGYYALGGDTLAGEGLFAQRSFPH